jgi:hypothetical protein
MPVARFTHNLIKIGKNQYRNPIYLAKEWRKALDNGHYASLSELACHLKVSRARVTQIMNLLNLSPKVVDIISSLGDPISNPIIAERMLRPLLDLVPEKQVELVQIILSKGNPKQIV